MRCVDGTARYDNFSCSSDAVSGPERSVCKLDASGALFAIGQVAVEKYAGDVCTGKDGEIWTSEDFGGEIGRLGRGTLAAAIDEGHWLSEC